MCAVEFHKDQGEPQSLAAQRLVRDEDPDLAGQGAQVVQQPAPEPRGLPPSVVGRILFWNPRKSDSATPKTEKGATSTTGSHERVFSIQTTGPATASRNSICQRECGTTESRRANSNFQMQGLLRAIVTSPSSQ